MAVMRFDTGRSIAPAPRGDRATIAPVQLLALDFDGVISDSAPESFLVALRTYGELRPESRLAGLCDIAPERAPGSTGTELYARFLELMPLGNRAEDFGVALAALDDGHDVHDQATYDRVRDDYGAEFRERFHRRFYEVRAELRERDPKRWAALLEPYPAFLEILRRRAGEVVLAIATAKDRESVDLLLRAYGVASMFPDELIVDKEAGDSKREHLARLREQMSIPFGEITFVDDKVNHLEAVASLGVRCALAGWGYNGPRERALARQSGHLVCTLEDVEHHVFGDVVAKSSE